MYHVGNSCTLYVSPTVGDDHENGLAPVRQGVNAPFQTIRRALRAVRELRCIGDNRPMTIQLTEDICLKESLSVDMDGVTIDGNGHKIIGGVKVDGFQEDIFLGKPCYSAKVPEGCGDFTDLWVDGKRAEPTRYPQSGTFLAMDTENNQTELLYDGSSWFVANPKDVQEVKGLDNAIVNFTHFWIDEHSPVKDYDEESGRITMQYRSRFRIDTDPRSPAAMKYYFTHIAQPFCKENEWFFDREKGVIYYAGEVGEAYIPVVSRFFEISARNVRLRNLELTCTKGDYASRMTTVDGQLVISETDTFGADVQSVCWAPGAIIFENAVGCHIENCYIHGIGIHGIEIKTGCKGIRIENNRITDLGAGGIKIFGGEYEEDAIRMTTDCVIKGNEIADCGKRYAAGCGILACNTSFLEIAHNHIHHLGYSGISVGWVWGYGNSSSHNNIIRGNHIHHIGTGELSDMGGIYLLGNQPGIVVAENRIHHVICDNYGGWGLYADEGSSHITFENNVVFCTKSTSFHQHYGHNNVVKNNVFAYGDGCVQITLHEFHTSAIFENNIYYTSGEYVFSNGNERNSSLAIVGRNNLFWDCGGEVQLPDGRSLEEWQTATGKEPGSMVADPLFANAENFDFTLTADSPALALGFKPLKGFPATET